MAVESQLGEAAETLSTTVLDQLAKFLSDSNATTTTTQDAGNGSTVIVSSGGNADVNIVITPPTSQIAGNVSEGEGVSLDFVLPAETGFVQKSAQTEGTSAAQEYIASVIDKYIGVSTAEEVEDLPQDVQDQREALIEAVADALALLQESGFGAKLTIRNIDFFGSSSSKAALLDDQQGFTILDSDGSFQGIDSLVGANDVLLDAGGSTSQQLFVINLGGLGDRSLVLANIDAAVLSATGTVKVEGNAPIRITSDASAQNISGGGGNDTLVGTGADTLTGGAGNDVFGFSGRGKYTITDFAKAGDTVGFDIPGLTNINQLKANVTSVVKTDTSITYNFGPDASITLVGVSASDLTAGMIKFTL